MPDFVVFASGQGSNFIALDEAFRQHSSHRLLALVTDRPGCGAAAHAQERGIPVIPVAYGSGRPKADVEAELVRTLRELHPALLVLAGYMRIIGPTLLGAFPDRIVNIHPSLLPRHPGAHGIQDSWESGDRDYGITIHYVDTGVDTGPLILQESITRGPDLDREGFEANIHALEHRLYPQVVGRLLDNLETGA